MSIVKRNIAHRKLEALLSVADDDEFLVHVWAVDAIQSNREPRARRLLSYPPEAVTANIQAPHFIHKWRLETLVNELLATRKKSQRPGQPVRKLNCGRFETTVAAINALNKLENAEDIVSFKRHSVLSLLPRLTHRQFEWQRGFFSHAQIYRAHFLYAHTKSSEFFLDSYGLSIRDFFNCGLALYALMVTHPGFKYRPQ